jgi:adenosylcobyric acid synthase
VPEKSTSQVRAEVISGEGILAGAKGLEVSGYEIHMGQTVSPEKTGAFRVVETPQGNVDYTDGMLNENGTVFGTYMHGLFYNDNFRQVFLNNLRKRWGLTESSNSAATIKDKEYDKLADLIRQNLDMAQIYRILEAGV